MAEPILASPPTRPPKAIVLDAAAQLSWPGPEHRDLAAWEAFASFDNVWDGHILHGLLENEGVPAKLVFAWPDLGMSGYSVVFVPRDLAHRARWILSWPAPSEAELTFLATGEMPTEGGTER